MANGIVGRAQGFVADQTELLQLVVDGLGVYNQTALPVIAEMCADVIQETMRVPQSPLQFNRHSDGGSPESQRQSYRLLSTPLEDWEAGAPFTVIGLQDALPSDISATLNGIMAGDAERMNAEFWRACFTKRTAGSVGTSYQASFYNGETDVPNYKNTTHYGSPHAHFVGINTTTLALSHLQTGINHIRHHGYGLTPGSLVAWFNTAQLDDLENLLNMTVATYLQTPSRVIAQEQGAYNTGVQYAGCQIQFDDGVPSGYFAILDRTVQPMSRRLHRDPQYRGLQMYASSFNENYPLAGQTFLNRYGFAVRQLGAGYCAQIVGSTSYTNPTWRLAN